MTCYNSRVNKRVVLYVPGLGDTNPVWQQRAVRTWRLYGVEPHIFVMHWADGESFDKKLNRLTQMINELYGKNKVPVSLVASSAGASAVLHAYVRALDNVKNVVIICGKIAHPETVSKHYRQTNPAFATAMDTLPAALRSLSADERARVTSLIPLADHIVPVEDMRLTGARHRRLWSVGHIFTIAAYISVLAWYTLWFVRKH